MLNLASAESVSRDTLQRVYDAITAHQCFRLEAGAGAGKTYSLIKAIKHIIDKFGSQFERESQQIACITYTNVAKNEIIERTDNNPLVLTDTIHGFAWSMISKFQNQLRDFLPSLGEKWVERIQNGGGIEKQVVTYDLGFPSLSSKEITLHHDDVLTLFCKLIETPKFRNLLKGKCPVVFIDEYQDTNKQLSDAIIRNLIEADIGILVGFFGDAWQRIYGKESCGLIPDAGGRIAEINKGANFRSKPLIVDMLNRMRPELPQQPCESEDDGEIRIFHSNSWEGIRRTEPHWKGDLPLVDAHNYLERTKEDLKNSGWDFSANTTKVLMLTHNVLAEEQGYKNLIDCFQNSDEYLKPNDHYVKFFFDTLIPAKECFRQRRYGKLFEIIKRNSIALASQNDKAAFERDFSSLSHAMEIGTINDVLGLLTSTSRPKIPTKIEDLERWFSTFDPTQQSPSSDDRDLKRYNKIRALKSVAFSEVENLYEFINEKTVFSTKHSVKGAEFNNVLVVCGRGWNHYDWNQLLEWLSGSVPTSKVETFERNRNLFYVACSRAKNRFSILFTQKLSDAALASASRIFGDSSIIGEPPSLR